MELNVAETNVAAVTEQTPNTSSARLLSRAASVVMINTAVGIIKIQRLTADAMTFLSSEQRLKLLRTETVSVRSAC